MTQQTHVDNAEKNTVGGIAARLVSLALIDAFTIWFVYQLVVDGNLFLAVLITVITLLLNAFFTSPRLYPYRWFSPGLALMLLMVFYPLAFTFYIAFTNYGTGNILTQQQALQQITQQRYAAEDAVGYEWTAYQNEAGEVLLWLRSEETDEVFIGRPDAPLLPLAQSNFNVPPDTAPNQLGDYAQLSAFQAAANPNIAGGTFGEGASAVQIPTGGGLARALQPLYDYNAQTNTLVNNQTGNIYRAVRGTFTAEGGDEIIPGYYTTIGMENFTRLFTLDLFGGEFLIVFVWTFLHAFLAVFVTFALGLALAIVMNHDLVPAKKVLRSMLLIPYAIPAFISVLIWRGLMDPNTGVVNEVIGLFTFGLVDVVPWRSDVFWSRTAIILIQLWLGFPYMLLICTGALQGIPADMYEAAEVDGAGPWTKFWRLTLPLLLVAVGPLLIASFAFNFNNFTVIQLYNDGRPTISTDSVAGYTDILITYTYEVAFSSGRGADYGYATAITIVIFVLLAAVTLFNFRLTNRLEEISENV